jgi:serine protease Do
MSRRVTLITVSLTAFVAFLVGAILAGGLTRSAVVLGTPKADPSRPRPRGSDTAGPGSPVSFADVVERINAAVVNVDATASRLETARSRAGDSLGGPLDFGAPSQERGAPRRGSGTGFIIDADGSILTNSHVVERAERITVKLVDGRSLLARVIGADPDTDVALIKVDGQADLPVAPLGDSSTLRTGDWVCAIGNPLGYEHTVTVGVVSYMGRKLFDTSLDNYIQTDAAINFGNSGGPLINANGEVVGINAAISSRSSGIGFAVPMNAATTILPQLRADGRVARGYLGVAPTDVDPDLDVSLGLKVRHGALVQDVTEGSPGDRAGLRPYDVIVSVDGRMIATGDDLIREMSARAPGSATALRLVRNGREQSIMVKLSERPARRPAERGSAPIWLPPDPRRNDPEGILGLTVREIDRQGAERVRLRKNLTGVVITRVEPMSAAFDAAIERGMVVTEINRQRVASVADYRRIARAAHPGDIVTFYLYSPGLDQLHLKTVRIDDR